MFYPCPHCQFLVAHHPQLRPLPAACPRCGQPLQEEGATPDEEGTTPGAGRDARLAAFDAGVDSRHDDARAAQEEGEGVVSDAVAGDPAAHAGAPPLHAAAPHLPGTAPAAFASPPSRDRWARWSWPLIAVLALLLALQILLADRARLAADPRWRPLLESLCTALRCDLPAWHEPAAFTMLDRKVRPATQAGALRIDATFRNDARWPQDWPALQLALSDADGRVLGSRVFQPGDYLGAAPATRLSPGQSAQITFMVQEPAPGTVAFSFEFR